MADDIGARKEALEYHKVFAGYRATQYKNLTQAIIQDRKSISSGYEKLAADTARMKNTAVEVAGRYYANRDSGTAAQRMRSAVEMAKLVVGAPIDFAKAAYVPDVQLLTKVQQYANPSGDSSTADATTGIPQKAWELFYTMAPIGAGNLWGTYREMERLYGEDRYSKTYDGNLAGRRTSIQAQLNTEKGGAEGFNEAYRALTDLPSAYDAFLARNPGLDRDADATYALFAQDAGIMSLVPKVTEPTFVERLTSVVKDPRSYEKELYREDYTAGIRAAEKSLEDNLALRDQLSLDAPGTRPGQTEDTDRDLMADWLKRPEVQEWAKRNGFRVGRVEEVSDQMRADIEAGKIPADRATKYGVYTAGPDDWKAVRFYEQQMKRDPSRNVFRAANLTRAGGKPTVIEVEIGADPALYQDPDNGKFYKNPDTGKYVKLADAQKYITPIGLTPDGYISRLPTGEYVWSTDRGHTWNKIPKSAGDKLMEKVTATAEGGVVGLEATDQPPPVKTYIGVERPMYANDAPGSARWVNEETGNEEYAAPEDIRRVNRLGLRSDYDRKTPADVVRDVVSKPVLKKQGFAEDENEMDIGEKPDQRKSFFQQYPGGQRASVQGRREAVNKLRKELPTLPDKSLNEDLTPRPLTNEALAEYEQRARASSETQPVESRTLQGVPTRPGAERYQPSNPGAKEPSSGLLRPPTGPSNGGPLGGHVASPEGATVQKQTGTTTPNTTTPTASTAKDPRRAAFKRPKPPAEETATQP